MTNMIYQVHILLKDSEPKIWRRVQVPTDLLLEDFHKVIQTSMGWTNSHMHQFISDQKFYTPRITDDEMWNELYNVDYENIKVSKLLKEEGDEIIYEYDFGDGWQHEIVLEKILPVDQKKQLPVCLGGKMNCPPEDVGGTWGYAEMLRILRQPQHKEHKNYLEWLGGSFDPGHFDLEKVNKLLQEKDFGCIEL